MSGFVTEFILHKVSHNFANIMKDTIDIFLKEEPHALEEIGKVAAKIAYYNFDWRYVTLVMLNALKYTLALNAFLKNYDKSIVVKLGKYIPKNRFAVPQFIIFGQDSNEIVETIIWLDKMKYDNCGKYIIICSADEYEKCDEAKIFIILVRVKIVNVVYMRAKSYDDFMSFSYDIVSPEKCLSSEPYNINVTNNCTNNECLKTVYPEKLNNFYKCPLIISTFEQPPFMYLTNDTLEPSGGDGDILKEVANALNATLIIKIPDEGNDWGHYEDGDWTGSLGDVYNDRVHASVCSLPVTADKYSNFTISFVYNSMDIVWTAKMPAEKPAWQKLFNPLQMSLRIALFLSFLAIVFINVVMKMKMWQKIRIVLKIGPTRLSLLFYSWISFLGMPILRMPNNPPLLFIIYSWIWFSFVIKNAYQGALISSLKKHDYEDSFPSFDYVLKGKYPYGGPAVLKEYFVDDHHIYDSWISLEYDDAYEVLDQISGGTTQFVLAFNKEIIVEHLIYHKGLRHLQILPDKIVNSPTVMYFKKHSVLTQPVSGVLSILVEAGLTQFMHARYLRHKKILFKIMSENNNSPLNLENVKVCTFLLVSGWSLSIIFFVAEAYCGRLQEDLN